MTDGNNKSNNKNEEQRPVVVRNTTDLQRLKLEKLMKNPDKLVIIPEKPKGRSMPNVPDFVRNVMGSSAGAGSGEFHVYRHLRRKEYARQKFIQEKSERERLNDEYHQKLNDNRKVAEEKTAKKRAKRQKRKGKAKGQTKKQKLQKSSSSSSESDTNDSETNEKNQNDDSIVNENDSNNKVNKNELEEMKNESNNENTIITKDNLLEVKNQDTNEDENDIPTCDDNSREKVHI